MLVQQFGEAHFLVLMVVTLPRINHLHVCGPACRADTPSRDDAKRAGAQEGGFLQGSKIAAGNSDAVPWSDPEASLSMQPRVMSAMPFAMRAGGS